MASRVEGKLRARCCGTDENLDKENVGPRQSSHKVQELDLDAIYASPQQPYELRMTPLNRHSPAGACEGAPFPPIKNTFIHFVMPTSPTKVKQHRKSEPRDFQPGVHVLKSLKSEALNAAVFCGTVAGAQQVSIFNATQSMQASDFKGQDLKSAARPGVAASVRQVSIFDALTSASSDKSSRGKRSGQVIRIADCLSASSARPSNALPLPAGQVTPRKLSFSSGRSAVSPLWLD